MSMLNNGSQLEHISRYEVFEIELGSTVSYSNPFTEITICAVFESPSGRKLTVYGFYDGENIWRIRIAPDEIGMWGYTTVASDTANTGLHNRTGTFFCVSSSDKGFIRVDPLRKYWFSYSDGSPFFGMGDTCYGMVNNISDIQRREYLDTRSAQKFNFVRFFASGFADKPHSSLDFKSCWPWGGTIENPDFDRFNLEFFRRLERILVELEERGMYAEIEVFNLYMLEGKHGNVCAWFNPPERREQWIRYLVSRLAAFASVFLWTVTNEYILYPDGIYRYDAPSDDEWVRSMGNLLHKYDPHKHPTTVHPVFLRYPGHVFGNSDEIDVITHQQNSCGTAKWIPEPLPGYYDGSGREAGMDIYSERCYNKPVINTENGYEWLLGYVTDNDRQIHGTDKCRHTAWRIFIAGGAAYAAGFQSSWGGYDGSYWYNCKTGEMDGPLPFIVTDMGLAQQLGYYYDFIMNKTDFLKMDPAMSIVNLSNPCLANIGKEYVVYAPWGGNIILDLSECTGIFTVEWLNTRNGLYSSCPSVAGGVSHTFDAPDNNDWILHLKLLV